ncbi:MAG: type III pantothenate kinase, partial [Myxococcota bacterium]
MTVLLVVDIGNTNISLGVFDYDDEPGKDDLVLHWRLSTHRELTSDELASSLQSLFSQEGREISQVTDVIMSSVVPPLVPIWNRVATKLFDREPHLVGPGMRTGMPVRYENPSEVGADRIVNSVAAYEIFGGPVIAVDFGTATTFDCVSKKGEYMGGCLFPG